MWNNDRLFTSRRVSAHPDCYLAWSGRAHMLLRHMRRCICEETDGNKLMCWMQCFSKQNDIVNSGSLRISLVLRIWQLQGVTTENSRVFKTTQGGVVSGTVDPIQGEKRKEDNTSTVACLCKQWVIPWGRTVVFCNPIVKREHQYWRQLCQHFSHSHFLQYLFMAITVR